MNKTVLIVEDETILQEVYELVLSSQGYEVALANNGAEGIQQLRAKTPDLVLLDLFMPVMDGREFLRNVNISDYPDTKFVVCTNLSDSDTETEMLELGAHKFVLKASMDPTDLLALADEMTNR